MNFMETLFFRSYARKIVVDATAVLLLIPAFGNHNIKTCTKPNSVCAYKSDKNIFEIAFRLSTFHLIFKYFQYLNNPEMSWNHKGIQIWMQLHICFAPSRLTETANRQKKNLAALSLVWTYLWFLYWADIAVTISSIQNWSAGGTLGFEIEYLNIGIQHAYNNIGFRYSDVQNYLIQKPNC